MITLWHPKIIRSIMHTELTTNAPAGGSIFESLGPAISIAKIPAIHISPWLVLIPKSAWRSTKSARSTVTPATLLPFPVSLLYIVTTATQNAITRYTLKLYISICRLLSFLSVVFFISCFEPVELSCNS